MICPACGHNPEWTRTGSTMPYWLICSSCRGKSAVLYGQPGLCDWCKPPLASVGGSGRGGEEGFSQGSPGPAPTCDHGGHDGH